MDILYLLIPLSALLVLGILLLFAWALRGGQFEDLEREGERILGADDDRLDVGQSKATTPREQSRSQESTRDDSRKTSNL